MKPLTRRKYVLRWKNAQDILREKIKLQNITQWSLLGLLLSTLYVYKTRGFKERYSKMYQGQGLLLLLCYPIL